MSNIKEDKVSFHIRSDFSDRDAVERHNIERGDSYALRHYILKFMQTVPNKRNLFGKIYMPLPKFDIAAFICN